MKKILAVFLLAAWVFSLTPPPLVCAQKGKTADPPAKAQGAIAADSDQYVIGPEDVLLIYVWKEESITKTVPVRIDGKISLPLVNDIQAAGLTPLQLKEVITEKLKNFVASPTVTVTVMEANSFKVYVSGEVKQPGVHRIRSETTLVELIIIAGGFTEWADQEKILIITKEKGAEKRMTVNYKKIIEGEEPDIVIKRGDTIMMEANSFKVNVSGEVKQPGVHRIRSETTLVELIIIAGGFTEWADQKKILITTKEKGAEKRMTVNYKKIIEGEEPDIVIKGGDTIMIEANSFKVNVSGEVKQPGVHRIRSETTLVELIIIAGGFTEWADQKKILIITKEKGAEKRMTVNYKKIIEGEEPDIVIKGGDTIIAK